MLHNHFMKNENHSFETIKSKEMAKSLMRQNFPQKVAIYQKLHIESILALNVSPDTTTLFMDTYDVKTVSNNYNNISILHQELTKEQEAEEVIHNCRNDLPTSTSHFSKSK